MEAGETIFSDAMMDVPAFTRQVSDRLHGVLGVRACA
jgi:hypothetical protein